MFHIFASCDENDFMCIHLNEKRKKKEFEASNSKQTNKLNNIDDQKLFLAESSSN